MDHRGGPSFSQWGDGRHQVGAGKEQADEGEISGFHLGRAKYKQSGESHVLRVGLQPKRKPGHRPAVIWSPKGPHSDAGDSSC